MSAFEEVSAAFADTLDRASRELIGTISNENIDQESLASHPLRLVTEYRNNTKNRYCVHGNVLIGVV